MKKTNIKITRYDADPFYVDIVEKEKLYEAWILRKNYGVSNLMFGMPIEQQDYNEFLDIVFCNLSEYAETYDEEMEEREEMFWQKIESMNKAE